MDLLATQTLARLAARTHRQMMDSLVDRHHDKIAGVLSCWDRVVVQGTLPGLCYAAGMTSYLNANHIRVFDYPRFAQPLRDQIRENAETIAKKAGDLPFDAGKVSRVIKRLRVHGLIKRVGRTYKYYLTALGRRALLAGLHIRALVLPQMLMADS
jgi:hypothetical protein